MAKLIIFQGDTLEREVELGEGRARIGRGPDNEIVLEDTTQSVSRHHAEVRFEQNGYTIVDTNSQNGLWVDGRRVPQVLLAPGVPVVMGPYKVVLQAERAPVEHAVDATVVMRPPASADTTTITRKSATASPPTETAAAPTAAAPVEPPKAAPVPPPPVSAPPAAPTPAAAAEPARDGISTALILAGVSAVLMMMLVAMWVFVPALNPWTGRSGDQGETSTTPAGAPPSQESQPIATPTPVPTVETPPPPEPTPVATPTPEPPAPEPTSEDSAPPPAAPTARDDGQSTPARPKAPPRRSDPSPASARAPKEKPANLDGMLEEARSAIIKGDYLAAIAGLETIIQRDPSYPNAENLLNVARGGARNGSQLAVDMGNQAEMRADYATASKQYERALELDPGSRQATDAIRRLKARMQSEGEDLFKRARTYQNQGRKDEAIAAYEKALQLLPPDHASAALARESLAILKGGA